MTLLVRVIVLTVLAAGTSACTLLRSRSVRAPLDMPAPPPRVVPIESQPIVAAPTVDDVPSRAPDPIAPTQPPPPPARADRGEAQAPARTETPAEAAPAAPAPNPAPAPPPALQTTANPEAEQRTRVALENAKRDLNRIDSRRLNADAKSQYDIARRFVQQAEEALRVRNPVFAEQLADKAAQIAALLQKR